MRKLLLLIVLLLFLVPVQAQEFKLADILLQSASAEESEFTIFLLVISEADYDLLENFARTDPDWTVFAPSDEAFRSFLEANDLSVRALLANEELLQALVHYHVVEGSYSFADLSDMESIPSLLADSEINITFEDDVLRLNNYAAVIIENVAASNGVLHVIDQVLIPADFRDSMIVPEMTPEPEATEASG
jgi:uncharacterized surface protein with fasciclin (FAS1) repeats